MNTYFKKILPVSFTCICMLREHCPLGMFVLKINRGGLCNVFRLKKILAFLFVTFKQYFTNRFKMMSVKRCFSVILSLCTVYQKT